MKYWHKINFFNNLLLYSLPFLFSSSNNFQIESLSEVQQRNRRLYKYELSFKWISLEIFKRQICSVINFLFMTNIASSFALNNFQIKSYLKVSVKSSCSSYDQPSLRRILPEYPEDRNSMLVSSYLDSV